MCVSALKHSPSKRKSISKPQTTVFSRPLEGDFDSTGKRRVMNSFLQLRTSIFFIRGCVEVLRNSLLKPLYFCTFGDTETMKTGIPKKLQFNEINLLIKVTVILFVIDHVSTIFSDEKFEQSQIPYDWNVSWHVQGVPKFASTKITLVISNSKNFLNSKTSTVIFLSWTLGHAV